MAAHSGLAETCMLPQTSMHFVINLAAKIAGIAEIAPMVGEARGWVDDRD